MSFHYPFLLLLLIPVVVYIIWLGLRGKSQLILRFLILFLLVFMAAGPQAIARHAGGT